MTHDAFILKYHFRTPRIASTFVSQKTPESAPASGRLHPFQDGILGEVKGNYSFAGRVGQYNPDLDAITEIVSEAQRQIPVANRHGLPLEWHVRRQDLTFFENVLGDELLNQLILTPY